MQVYQLTEALSRLGVEQEIITVRPPWEAAFEQWDNVTVRRYGLPLPIDRQLYELPALLAAYRYASNGFDLVHIHHGEDIAAIPIGLTAAKHAHIPVIITLHSSWNLTYQRSGLLPGPKEMLGKQIEKIGISHSDALCTLTITFSTLTTNKAPTGADLAIDYQGSGSIRQVTISNSIVAADPAHAGPDISGTLLSAGYNLFQDNSGATFDPSTAVQHRTDKLLSSRDLSRLFASPMGLRNNGGPTLTYALASGSLAIDAIPLQYCQLKVIFDSQSKKYTDQRGFPRPDRNEGACDIGAYEYVD